MKDEKLKHSFDAEVHFKSHKTDFHLLLTEDIGFKHLQVESYLPNNSTRTEEINVKMFEGIVNDKSVPSYVIGYLHNNVFIGTIEFNETLYFVEPANKFFSSVASLGKIIVYRQKDTVFPKNNVYTGKNKDAFLSWFNHDITNMMPRGINKTKNANDDYACVIELVSDHTLYDYFHGDIDALTAFLYLHGKYADIIFRQTNFDGDGEYDRIRIITKKISIYKSENDDDYPMNKASDMNTYLKLFSLRKQNYCLAVSMCYRRFSDSSIGIAFKANAALRGPPGGICQKPIPLRRFSSEKVSLNTAAVTIRNAKGITFPASVTFLAVAHELGHSFGSNHDSTESLLCSPGGLKGFYIMHAKSQSDQKPLSMFFSPCSKIDIAAVISTRGECLKPNPAVCGNAIREGDEDCDCGKEAICQSVDRCCTPSDAKPPEKGCTFRKSKGAVCSDKENKCCLSSCTVNTDKNFICYNDNSRCRISYCDGKNSKCPKPKRAPDKYPCQGTSKSCSRGFCNSSVCLDNGLKECVCKEVRLECYICCEKSDACAPASSLGFKTPNGKRIYALEGTPCNYDRFQCDGAGTCINPYGRNLGHTKSSLSLWWAVGGLSVALLVVVFFLGYFLKRHYFNE